MRHSNSVLVIVNNTPAIATAHPEVLGSDSQQDNTGFSLETMPEDGLISTFGIIDALAEQ